MNILHNMGTSWLDRKNHYTEWGKSVQTPTGFGVRYFNSIGLRVSPNQGYHLPAANPNPNFRYNKSDNIAHLLVSSLWHRDYFLHGNKKKDHQTKHERNDDATGHDGQRHSWMLTGTKSKKIL